MFELDFYDASQHRAEPAAPDGAYELADDVERISLLVWGEHCVECAAPSCFSTCDLYRPRRDRACRRLRYGVFRNEAFPSARGYGAEIEFERWGKLMSRGSTWLSSQRRVLRLERVLRPCARLLNGVGGLAARLTGNLRHSWAGNLALEHLVRRMNQRAKDRARPDAFLMEVYNPGPEPVALQLVMSVDPRGAPPGTFSLESAPFVERVEIPPGYFRHDVPASRFRRITDDHDFNLSIVPEAEEGTHLVFLTLDFVAYAAAAEPEAGTAPAVKCVVFDLDDTLWEGVLLERDDVKLRSGALELLEGLDQRGILLSIASKNEHDHAWSKLEALGIASYFLHPRINWRPKSENVEEIARRLNLGLDSFAFVDDNPFEREQVARALPTTTCLGAEVVADPDSLLAQGRFRGGGSSEAKTRRQLYRQAIERDAARSAYEDYADFLRSCEIELEIRPYDDARDAERAAELVQRTNQLNFSGHKYSREDFRRIVADPSREKWVLASRDRFGAYGTVGFCLFQRVEGGVRVQDFMLSCRVQGKFIEQAFFAHLAASQSADFLHIDFRPTDRNVPARNVLEQIGFAPGESGAMLLDLREKPLACDFIRIVAPEGRAGKTADRS